MTQVIVALAVIAINVVFGLLAKKQQEEKRRAAAARREQAKLEAERSGGSVRVEAPSAPPAPRAGEPAGGNPFEGGFDLRTILDKLEEARRPPTAPTQPSARPAPPRPLPTPQRPAASVPARPAPRPLPRPSAAPAARPQSPAPPAAAPSPRPAARPPSKPAAIRPRSGGDGRERQNLDERRAQLAQRSELGARLEARKRERERSAAERRARQAARRASSEARQARGVAARATRMSGATQRPLSPIAQAIRAVFGKPDSARTAFIVSEVLRPRGDDQ